jgi:hypothetical protein
MRVTRKITTSPLKVKYLTSRNGLIRSSERFRSMRMAIFPCRYFEKV